jgi:hypothetical protein
VLGAVDLGRDLVLVPHDVGPPPSPPRIAARDLPAGLGQAVRAHDPAGEVQLGQRLRAAHDVIEDAGHEGTAAQGLDPGDHLTQVVHPYQALLNAGGGVRRLYPYGTSR